MKNSFLLENIDDLKQKNISSIYQQQNSLLEKNNQSLLKPKKTIQKNQAEKKQLGQFFTTNSNYILQGFEEFVKDKIITDPFAGNQDLLNWSKQHNCSKAIGFDCDLKWVDDQNVFFADSLVNKKNYQFVCTNPPYLHKNKASITSKQIFNNPENSTFEDLYQIAINSCMNCDEGIFIVPLNFLSAKNSSKIRKKFFSVFKIVKLNIFLTQVFADTTYNVISFYFKKRQANQDNDMIETSIFPSQEKIIINLSKTSNYQFGGEFLKQINNTKNDLGVHRLTIDGIENGDHEVELAIENINNKVSLKTSKEFISILNNNILFLRAIDSKNGKKIQLEDIRNYNLLGLAGKKTSRNLAHLIFKIPLSIDQQIKILNSFNQKLNENRLKYSSFFLTNFRDNNRKRLSFDFAYKFINLIHEENETKQHRLF